MSLDDKLLTLIGQLYDVVLDSHRWPPLLEAISDLFGEAPVLFGQQNMKPAEQGRVVLARLNPEAFQTFMKDYRHPEVNPLTHSLQAAPVGHILTRQSVIDNNAFRSTIVYRDLFYPNREFPLVTTCLSGNGSVRINLSIRARVLAKPLEPDETRALKHLIPHLQRVLQLEQRLDQSHHLNTALADALDRLRLGVMVINAKGEVQSINQRAASILDLSDGLVIAQRQLKAGRPDDTKALNQLIHQAIRTTTAQGVGAGGFLSLPRPSQLRPFELLITPITRQALWEESEPPAALVFITDPEEEEELPIQVLQRFYGFTRTESEMAILLSQGHGLTYAADQLQVTINTAKSHQRQIFAKTGVHRQAELVRLLLTSLARLARP